MHQTDTIAAIATAAGEGAISIIRISGKDAISITQRIFTGPVQKYTSHTVHYGKILDKEGNTLDSVVLMIMRAPKSYTGEDSIELFCHGGSLITRRVLERVFEAGARAAKPGEFSLRAYLNGKIDLTQAEAVQQLIASKNELALKSAEKQLEGRLSQKILDFQKRLTSLAAILEAWVDFPEEGLEFTTIEELCFDLEAICKEMEHLKNTYHYGQMLHTGISLCLVGSPNVGKSSLMNALLGFDRAIVTEIAGTTRDVLEEDLLLGSLHFRLIDTAGIRDTEEIVEQEGIRRSKKMMKEADVVLLLLDSSRPLSIKDEELLTFANPNKTILVLNKKDLKQEIASLFWPFSVSISAKEKIGIDELIKTIEALVLDKGAPSKEEVTITHLRHKQALDNTISHCQNVIHALKTETSAEFVTSDLRAALNELSSIIGTNVTEDILSSIFSKFCLGK